MEPKARYIHQNKLDCFIFQTLKKKRGEERKGEKEKKKGKEKRKKRREEKRKTLFTKADLTTTPIAFHGSFAMAEAHK